MNVNWLQVVVHGIHVLAAVVAVGGAVFLRLVVMPSAAAALDTPQHEGLRTQLTRRWKIIVMVCIALLLITGLWTFFAWSAAKADVARGYHMVFGIKILLALGVFFIASALTGRAEVFAPMRANARLWVAVNALLGVLTILLGSVLSRMG